MAPGMTATAPRVTLAGDGFALSAPAPRVGQRIEAPGRGPRALLAAPCLEHRPSAAPAAFARAAAARRPDLSLIALSADDDAVRARWCRHAGWRPGRCPPEAAARLGIWLPRLQLFAPALLVIDAAGRLCHAEIVRDLAAEVDFDAALAALAGLA